MNTNKLQSCIESLVQPGKGILAIDESLPTIAKRFAPINVESTEHSRRDYRAMLLETPSLEHWISGVILFEETLTQSNDAGQ